MHGHIPLRLFQELLLAWYRKHGRTLRWRETLPRVPSSSAISSQPTSLATKGVRWLRNPYDVLVAEMMLQQTQVSTVIPKYDFFLKKWPTIEALSEATLSDVLIAWKGLGYNRRAKHLLETAKVIVHDYGGVIPFDARELKKLPGIGPYMASAIRVFAFGKQDAVIDVNVNRVLERVYRLQATGYREIKEVAEQSIPKERADEWHQALMDLGALMCTAKKPRCESCPVSRICRANNQARDQGFACFADWLSQHPTPKNISGKDQGKKFAQTDRYFRGRIIDYLRSGEKPMTDLQDHILYRQMLGDRKRFGSIVESLVIDGLIRVHGNSVMLG